MEGDRSLGDGTIQFSTITTYFYDIFLKIRKIDSGSIAPAESIFCPLGSTLELIFVIFVGNFHDVSENYYFWQLEHTPLKYVFLC